MNNLLQLKGRFYQRSSSGQPGAVNLPKNGSVKVEHLLELKDGLIKLLNFWDNEKIINGALIDVYYVDVIAKSNRISALLKQTGKLNNDSIVGAKFVGKSPKHVITYYVSIIAIQETITNLEKCINIINDCYKGIINYYDIEKINNIQKKLTHYAISKSLFSKLIVDCYYVEEFNIPNNNNEFTDNVLVTIYKTDIDTIELMKRIGINMFSQRIIDGTTMLLTPDQLQLLMTKAPYLISMSLNDISNLSKENFLIVKDETVKKIPKPTNEPVIGVIDTLFDTRCYFSEWVEYHKMISDEIEFTLDDCNHGTSVSSIIVDGPYINPNLDDGCGRFRARHFGVTLAKQMSSFSILKLIQEIVIKNRDIKVWNLSLGSALQVNPNFISPEAAILDKIQYENDVIFIIAGTNRVGESEEMIGAPADSINSLVVNSVDFENKPATYTRKGLVLSFFNKPDISYYGGDKNGYIRACNTCGECFVAGTSFAAPWISRKIAYLINVLGLSREIAKALIIDSASNWKGIIDPSVSSLIGYGVVPQKICDIIFSQNDEIKFVLEGISEKYDTYTYNLPVPLDKDRYPFVAKATLCYFPNCSRNQGVDYTNTELDFGFGRIDDGGHIKTINDNYQSVDGHYMYEGNARLNYRKWDNVKHIIEVLKPGTKTKKIYKNDLCGISVKTKERLEKRDGIGIKFGIVITLKDINGINRIDEFIRKCLLKEWFVTKVDIENKIDIYNKAEEEIHFE